MKTKLSLICIFVFSVLYSQKITVLDSETQKPIPYAKLTLKGKDYYGNTEENGEITLEKDEKVSEILSFGYENLLVQENKTKYFLKPKVIEIDEVSLVKPKFAHSFKIGSLKTYGGFGGGGSNGKTNIWGKVITFEGIKNAPLFIKKISFKTMSSKKNVVIKLLVFENNNGLPGELLLSEEIVCKEGFNKHQEFSPKQLLFPKEGVVVAFEWILNETNRIEIKTTMKDSQVTKKMTHFLPDISGCKEEEENTVFGALVNGEWKFQRTKHSNAFRFKFNPAIQLELTD